MICKAQTKLFGTARNDRDVLAGIKQIAKFLSGQVEFRGFKINCLDDFFDIILLHCNGVVTDVDKLQSKLINQNKYG